MRSFCDHASDTGPVFSALSRARRTSRMVHSRSVAGHHAKLLRSVLQERIQVTKGQQQSRIIRAIGLCDAFLNSCNRSPSALAVLEQQVVAALKSTRRLHGCAHAKRPETAVSCGISAASASQSESQASSFLDCTLPADLRLERKAFSKPTGFAHVAKLQDEIAKRDDVTREANKARFHARTRQLLDGQMQELAAQREAEARRKQEASHRLAEDIKLYQREQHAEQVAKRRQQEVVREQLQAQVHETQRKRDAAAAEAARTASLERQRIEKETREEGEARRQKQLDDHKKNQAFVRSMLQALHHKRVQADAAVAEERRYNKECIKRMDAEQAARDAAVAERKAKLEEAFRRGGGEALSASLAERALADEQRAAQQQAAYAAAQQARERERQQQRDLRTQEQLGALKIQMEEKQQRIQQERQEAAAFGAKAIADAECMKQQAKARRAAARVQKAEELRHLKELFVQEQKRKYHDAQDAVPEDHLWLHKKVVEGSARGFITFPSIHPSV